MPLLLRKRLILMKLEVTYGTDPVPTGAANAVLVRDLNIVPLQSDVVSRDLVRPYLGASEQLLANTRVQCTFSVELAGSGTAGTPPAYGPALKASGMTETIVASPGSVTYAPTSSSAPSSVTIYYNIDGILHKVTGARGTFVINTTVGQIPTIDFTFTGIYNGPTDTAAASPTYANQATPVVFKNGNTTGFELFSYSGALQTLSFDIGNSLVYRELVGGTKQTLLTDRRSNGSLTMEAVVLGAGGHNYFTDALADGTLGNLLWQHGQTAGNIIDFTSTRIDIGDVSYADQDGIAMLTIPYTAVPSTAGNDEFQLIYT
jgi:hypothetical protein